MLVSVICSLLLVTCYLFLVLCSSSFVLSKELPDGRKFQNLAGSQVGASEAVGVFLELRLLEIEAIFIYKKQVFMWINSGGAGAIAAMWWWSNDIRTASEAYELPSFRKIDAMLYDIPVQLFQFLLLLRQIGCESLPALTEKYLWTGGMTSSPGKGICAEKVQVLIVAQSWLYWCP